MVKDYNYLIHKNGSTYYATDGLTGEIVTSSAAASTVFQYCATALSNGGVIALKRGTYTLLTKVTLYRGTFVEGNGSIIDATGLNNTVFDFTTSGTVNDCLTGVCDMYFLGAIANTSARAVRIYGVQYNARIEKIYLYYMYNGVMIDGICYGGVVRDVCCTYMKGVFIDIVGETESAVVVAPNAVVIDHCIGTSGYSLGTGLRVMGNPTNVASPNPVIIHDSYFEDFVVGMYISGANPEIHGNLVSTPTSGTVYGIRDYSGSARMRDNIIAVPSADGIGIAIYGDDTGSKITNNAFFVCAGTAIGVDGDRYAGIIEGNDCSLSGLASAIFLTGNCMNAMVEGNQINGGALGYGIAAELGMCKVSNNHFIGTLTAITITGSHNSVIGNHITSATNGIVLTASETTDYAHNHFFTNVTNPFVGAIGDNLIHDNFGNVNYITKAAGKLQFTAATTLDVTHGLVATPTKVLVTGTDANSASLFVDTIGGTTFKVTRINATGTPWIYWYAEV